MPFVRLDRRELVADFSAAMRSARTQGALLLGATDRAGRPLRCLFP
jgi:hypothetical protein